MSNEIKVGDKVRFNYDTTPRIYLIYSKIGIAATCVVDDIQDGNSVVKYDDSEQIKTLVIPTKYLIKVDAETKEAKYKYQVGQKVKSAYANEILTIKERCGRASHDNVYKVEEYAYTWNECELQPCTEPAEHTEAEKKPNFGSITIPVKADLTDSYWDAYAADLAKEVVLKVANKFNAPHEAAEYAVTVAKAVVEGLKRE